MKISFEDYPDIRRFLRNLSSTGDGPYLADGYGLIFEDGLKFGSIFRRVDRTGNTGIAWYFVEVPGFREFLKANYPEFFI